MKNILIVVFLFGSIANSQNLNKYLVYFKDKGISKSNTLSKFSTEYQTALTQLTERSIERRSKVLGDEIIGFDDLPLKKQYIKEIQAKGVKIVWRLKWFNAVSCWLSDNQMVEIRDLKSVEKIEKVKTIRFNKRELENNILSKTEVENEISYNLDYGFSITQNELSDIPAIHDLGFSGQDVLIGLLDAGFAWRNHPSLKNADVVAEHDFVYGDSSTDDGDAGHGTAVFSLIGGFDEGWLVGPAYNAKYALAKTENINSETHVEEDNYAAALQWMDSLGVDISSSSLGYSEFDEGEGSYTYEDMDGETTIVTQASEIAFSKGILTISSAGNEGNKSWKYITAPADGFNTIAVGAVSSSNNIAAFSSVGPTYDKRIKPEIVTQGVSCYHAIAYTQGYGFGNGTSYSAPIASGIAVQLLSAYPYLKNTQMRRIIMESGDNPEEPDNSRGYGLLSAKRVLDYPNLKEEASRFTLNKMFVDETIGENDDVFVAINDNTTDAIPVYEMIRNGNYYSFELPLYPIDTELIFDFSITKENGSIISFPGEYYKLIYGSLDIVRYTDKEIVQSFQLYQNYPNPFNSSTTIMVDLPESSNLELKVYNILGQEVKTIFSGEKQEGKYSFQWNGYDNYGSRVSSGVYIYRITAEGINATQKMILLN